MKIYTYLNYAEVVCNNTRFKNSIILSFVPGVPWLGNSNIRLLIIIFLLLSLIIELV